MSDAQHLLLRLDCGCIVWDLHRPAGPDVREYLLLRACDCRSVDEPLGICWRRFDANKRSARLSDEEAIELLEELGRLAADGARYRSLRHLLRIMVA